MDRPEGWTAGTVRANGVDLAYYRGGDGPPVVMAHGFGANGRCQLPVATELTDEFEVVTYDARAHGRSGAPATGYDVRSRVADLGGLVAALDLSNPVLVGHSMGAATVAWTAAEHPDLPRGVVLEDPVGLHEHVPDRDEAERVADVREGLDAVAGRSVEDLAAGEYAEFDPDWARRLAAAATEQRPGVVEYVREPYPRPLRAVLADVAVPALVLRADADVGDRVRDHDALGGLNDVRVVHVPGAGHYVFHDAFAAALAELRTFLARV